MTKRDNLEPNTPHSVLTDTLDSGKKWAGADSASADQLEALAAAGFAVVPIAERDRLREINAELLEALEWAAPIVDPWFRTVDSNRGTKAQKQAGLDAMHAAIAKAEGESK